MRKFNMAQRHECRKLIKGGGRPSIYISRFQNTSILPKAVKLNTSVLQTFTKFCYRHPQPVREFAKFVMGDVRAFVEQKIAGKKVMIFSKRSCPYCTKAKQTLSKYVGNLITADQYEVLEIDTLDNTGEIQDYLQELTGARSVPRVFINQKFVGGGDDVVAKDKSGQLKALLA